MNEVQPDEIYNLAAQSHVQVSFDAAEYTGDVDALGVLRILEAVHMLGLDKKTRIYQASTSELLRQGGGVPPVGDDTLPSLQPLRSGKAVRLLDDQGSIGRLTACSPATVFSSTMSPSAGERPS